MLDFTPSGHISAVWDKENHISVRSNVCDKSNASGLSALREDDIKCLELDSFSHWFWEIDDELMLIS